MSENTKIEWCDATVNHWAGCTAVSPACDNCYAKAMAKRLWGVGWGAGVPRHRFANANTTLKALDRKAQRLGQPLKVFHNSLSDFFDNDVWVDMRIVAMWAMMETKSLIHLLLTKRIGNAKDMIFEARRALLAPGELYNPAPLHNVWIGTTICNQEEADRDIGKLIAVPAAKRFLSLEPLLGPVDLERWLEPAGLATDLGLSNPGIDWVIVGGESGPNARPMHPDWARSLRDQCQAAGVPFLFKQWGEWISTDQEPQPYGGPLSRWMWADGSALLADDGQRGMPLFCKVGKKAAGRLLDGRTWDGVPS